MTIAQSIARPIVSAGASPVTGGGGGGAASLDIRARVGTSTSPTSTGTKAVTGVGFQPKVVLLWGVAGSAVGTGVSSPMHFGAAVSSSSRAAISVDSRNGLTTSNTNRRHDNVKAVSIISAGSLALDADFSSGGADGFTLNWSTVDTARILNHICLGGADLEVVRIQGQMNNTNASDPFPHGMTGAPTGGLLFFVAHSTAPVSTTVTLKLGIGAFAGASQWGASIYSNTGVPTTSTRRLLSTSHMLADLTTSVQRSAAFASADATNLTLSYPDTGVATQYYFWGVLFRGAKCQVGTYNTAASNTIVTAGIVPKLFLPVFIPTGVGSVGTVLNDLMLTIGASDGTNNVSCGISDETGETTTDARRFQSSTSLCEYSEGGVKSFEATAAFSGQSVVVTPTTALTNFGEAGYLIVGS